MSIDVLAPELAAQRVFRTSTMELAALLQHEVAVDLAAHTADPSQGTFNPTVAAGSFKLNELLNPCAGVDVHTDTPYADALQTRMNAFGPRPEDIHVLSPARRAGRPMAVRLAMERMGYRSSFLESEREARSNKAAIQRESVTYRRVERVETAAGWVASKLLDATKFLRPGETEAEVATNRQAIAERLAGLVTPGVVRRGEAKVAQIRANYQYDRAIRAGGKPQPRYVRPHERYPEAAMWRPFF